jgi:hypothetical protein
MPVQLLQRLQLFGFTARFSLTFYVARLAMYWINHLPNHNPWGIKPRGISRKTAGFKPLCEAMRST